MPYSIETACSTRVSFSSEWGRSLGCYGGKYILNRFLKVGDLTKFSHHQWKRKAKDQKESQALSLKRLAHSGHCPPPWDHTSSDSYSLSNSISRNQVLKMWPCMGLSRFKQWHSVINTSDMLVVMTIILDPLKTLHEGRIGGLQWVLYTIYTFLKLYLWRWLVFSLE